MRKLTHEELNTILENHKHWINRDCDEWKSMRANLRYTNLRYTNLRYTNLNGADLRYADLSGANLRYADLRYTDLRYTDLIYANLSGADLRYADLSGANLSGADLSDVTYNDTTSFFALQCPQEGSFIGYKKAGDFIVKLLITEDSLRSSATSRKCRCSKAKVLDILNFRKEPAGVSEVASDYNGSFIYKKGEIVEVHDFNYNRWVECTSGIHFFITFEEAVNYR